MEYSLTFATLLVYLKDFLKVDKNLNAFYSSISGIYLLSMIIASIVVGKIFDRMRRARVIFCLMTLCVIIGNVLYIIPLSPWMLFFGRLISGMAGCLKPIMISELIRSYPPDEIIPQMSAVTLSSILGYTLGPCINFLFVKADFWFLGVRIEYPNAACLVVCLFFVLAFIVSLCFVSDLSREFDLKKALKDLGDDELKNVALKGEESNRFGEFLDEKSPMLEKSSPPDNQEITQQINMALSFKILFSHIDTISIFAMVFLHLLLIGDL